MAVEMAWMHAQVVETLVASSWVSVIPVGIQPEWNTPGDDRKRDGSSGFTAAARMRSTSPTRDQNPTDHKHMGDIGFA